MAGLLTKDTELHYKNGGSTFKRIDHLMSVPELGGDPEKVEVTTLQDATRKYIEGVKDPGDLAFQFLYDNDTVTSNFRVMQGLSDEEDPTDFKVVFPDGSEWAFSAYVSVKIDAGGVNEALTFTATMMLQSEFDISNPTGS